MTSYCIVLSLLKSFIQIPFFFFFFPKDFNYKGTEYGIDAKYTNAFS